MKLFLSGFLVGILVFLIFGFFANDKSESLYNKFEWQCVTGNVYQFDGWNTFYFSPHQEEGKVGEAEICGYNLKFSRGVYGPSFEWYIDIMKWELQECMRKLEIRTWTQ